MSSPRQLESRGVTSFSRAPVLGKFQKCIPITPSASCPAHRSLLGHRQGSVPPFQPLVLIQRAPLWAFWTLLIPGCSGVLPFPSTTVRNTHHSFFREASKHPLLFAKRWCKYRLHSHRDPAEAALFPSFRGGGGRHQVRERQRGMETKPI